MGAAGEQEESESSCMATACRHCVCGPKCNFNLMRSVDISGCSASAAGDMQVLCDKRVLSAEQRARERESNEVVGLP